VVLLGVITGDTVSLNTNGYVANFASANVGNGIALTVSGLTLSGASAANYALTQPGSLTANITAAAVTIASGITANNKVYDRTTTATLSSNNVVLLGVITGDTVSLNTNGYIANFASAGVGSGITVSVSGLTLNGASAANYALTQPLALTANITAPGVHIVADFPNIVISWPTNATIFVLNQTASLTPPVTWSPVTNSITVNGTGNTVTINTSTSEAQYFELVGAP
jgi:phosphotransferase system HPr-like phosphotransfer protein